MTHPGVRETPKSKDEKSQSFALRLHPSLPEEAAAIAFIRHYERQGLSLRRLFVEMVMELENRGQEDLMVDKFDAKVIKEYLQNIFDRVKNGLVMTGVGSSSAEMPTGAGLSEDDLDDYDRFLDMGLDASDVE